MKKRILYLLTFLLLIPAAEVFSLQESIVLGREDLWQGLTVTAGIRTVPGLEGYPDVILSDSEYRVTENTDLLMHFNTLPLTEGTSRYTLRPTSLMVSERNAKVGAGAGIFFQQEPGVILEARPAALLYRGQTITSDFSIEFWLYPAVVQEGETIVAWSGTNLVDNRLQPQEIRCSIRDRKIVWSFDNFFIPPDGGDYSITLTAASGLIPREWHHHLLRFNSSTGLLEYLRDGVPEAITYTTESRREESGIYFPQIGVFSETPLEIGSFFTGFLDELRVSRSFARNPVLTRYSNAVGTAVTRVLDLGYSGSALDSITAQYSTPDSTAVFFYYRMTDDLAKLSGTAQEWIPFKPGSPLPGEKRGRYLQLRFDLHTNALGTATPHVSEIEIGYEPDLPPAAPSRVAVDPGDGSVTLSWSPVPEPDIAGYLIYYGEKPGVYFGTDAQEGLSPVDVGKKTSVTLNGLTNGKLYYFAVAAYDSAEHRHTGSFSREISTRPARVYR